jgi:FKBP-type peptidyl-prolyl cis-trans isomerase FklB
MRVLFLLVLGLGVGTAWAQAAQPAGKSGKAKPAAKAPAEEVDAADDSDAPAAKKLSPAQEKALMKKASYVFGMEIGRNMKSQQMEVDQDEFLRGMGDAIAGKDSEMSEEEIQQVLVDIQNLFASRQRDKNATFLTANKKKEGVKTTPSGLQYKVLKSGKGKSPKPTDTVTTNYKGTLVNGQEFDSSYKRGQPASFPVNQVIPGWTEALQLMKVGDKWQLFIPSDLAYGPQGRPPVIPPNATLIFELELLGIEE